jgi:hypothetical protein
VPLSRWSRSYHEFVQACRAFRPTELVPKISSLSAALGEPPYSDQIRLRRPPWGLAVAARESLLYGNEYRERPVSERSIDDLMRRFFSCEATPNLLPGEPGFVLSIVTPLLYEQFPWQESIFEELARSHALLIEGLDRIQTSVISRSSLSELLGGMDLNAAIGATFVLQVGAYQNGGTYDQAWLDQSNFKEVLALFPRETLEVTASRLTATRAEFKADYEQNSHGSKGLARYDYNPLVRTPFINFGQDLSFAPAPRLIMRTVTPGGLYYPGVSKYGNSFAEDIGRLFEYYIGRNLGLIDGAEVHPEIAYGSRGAKKSVDWFVVMPGLVLLVECKLKRLGLAARAGDSRLTSDLTSSIDRAHQQLRNSIEALAMNAPQFSHIPSDRPIVALIVSAEPIYTGAAYLVERRMTSISSGRLADIPVATASARGIENLVTFEGQVEQILLERLHDRPPDGVLSLSDLHPSHDRKNDILEKAWDSYNFPSEGSVS